MQLVYCLKWMSKYILEFSFWISNRVNNIINNCNPQKQFLRSLRCPNRVDLYLLFESTNCYWLCQCFVFIEILSSVYQWGKIILLFKKSKISSSEFFIHSPKRYLRLVYSVSGLVPPGNIPVKLKWASFRSTQKFPVTLQSAYLFPHLSLHCTSIH